MPGLVHFGDDGVIRSHGEGNGAVGGGGSERVGDGFHFFVLSCGDGSEGVGDGSHFFVFGVWPGNCVDIGLDHLSFGFELDPGRV